MDVTSTTTQTASRTAAGAQGGATSQTARQGTLINSDFQTFLVMLTTQMQNQDPLNPIESSDYAAQLATFSGVEQQVRTNELLQALVGADGGAGLAAYAGWIGREVRSTAAAWFGDDPVRLEIAADKAADEVVLVTFDANGKMVSREAIGPGSGEVEWFGMDADGNRLPEGHYSFRIENWQGETKLSESPVESYSRVVGVEAGTNGAELRLAGGNSVAASAVSALRDALS